MSSPTSAEPFPAPSDIPTVAVLSLGGTIFMTQDEHGRGATPDADNAAMLSTLFPAGEVHLIHHEIANVGSSSVGFEHLRQALAHAERAVRDGARGIVVTQGTDTLEESAFLLDRYWSHDAPLVVTGAMRPANAPDADGPDNLRDAVRTALAPASGARGVLAVIGGKVHRADQVTKVDSRSLDAFASVPTDHTPPTSRHEPRPLPTALPVVPVLALGLGDDAELLDHVSTDTIDGLVITGSGVGHVPAAAVPRLRALVDAGVPVVIATRSPHGGTARDLYAYPGSETDLITAGCVMAGDLPAHKARLLLQTLLADRAGDRTIAQEFARYES